MRVSGGRCSGQYVADRSTWPTVGVALAHLTFPGGFPFANGPKRLMFWLPLMNELSVENLQVTIADTQIVRGMNLSVPLGEVHAIMGPNGSGERTLAPVLACHS